MDNEGEGKVKDRVMTKQFLTAKEAADYLGITEDELQKTIEGGRITVYRIGGVYTRFKVDDLDVYRRTAPKKAGQRQTVAITDRIKDFFYFNDFYIYSAIAIVIIVYFIFK